MRITYGITFRDQGNSSNFAPPLAKMVIFGLIKQALLACIACIRSPQDVAVDGGAKDAGWSMDATKRRLMGEDGASRCKHIQQHPESTQSPTPTPTMIPS